MTLTSIVTLYYDCEIEKDKNFILDRNGIGHNVELYLETLVHDEIRDFQYVKQGLSVTIKIDATQTKLMMGELAPDMNYCKIQNGDLNPCYYFIINKIWKSANTIELVLAMDTLNTFEYDVDYVVSPKTLVKRMHKDRFKLLSGHYSRKINGDAGTQTIFAFTSIEIVSSMPRNISIAIYPNDHSIATGSVITSGGVRYIYISFTAHATTEYELFITYDFYGLQSIIDLRSEEINVPTYKQTETTLYETINGKRNNWSLYYKSAKDETTPIDCYLIPEQSIPLKYQASTTTFTSENVPTNKYLIFSATYPNGVLSFKYGDTTYTLEYFSGEHDRYKLLAIWNNGGTIKVYTASFVETDIHGWVGTWQLVYTGNCDVINAPTIVYSYEVSSLPTSSQWGNGGLGNSSYATHTTTFSALVNGTIDGHDSIDKTLVENIKIINIPYSPTPYSIDQNNVYTFESCWTFNVDDKRLKLSDFNARWSNEINGNIDNIIAPMIYNTYQHINLWKDANRSIPDPKLFHSDYYRPKFVYDSFTKIFPLEKVNYDATSKDRNFKFKFIMSRNIVSKFLFKFDQIKYSYSNEDYDNIVAVSRNNEEVLYNSQYLDYIRTGYNYDLKAKERTETASGIGIGLNIAGLIASIGLSFVPGGQAIGIASVVGSTLGLAGQLVNYAKTTAQNEENIQRKLQETQMQGVSVMNADDYDLLYEYSENKAKYCVYNCSPQMQRILDDLFYYCGYSINEQMKPNTYTRRSFNFVQASLVINKTNNLPVEIQEDIIEKFEQGVTFLHYSFGKFDFDQDKENIELAVLPYFEEE